jgi:hypothetical protein
MASRVMLRRLLTTAKATRRRTEAVQCLRACFSDIALRLSFRTFRESCLSATFYFDQRGEVPHVIVSSHLQIHCTGSKHFVNIGKCVGVHCARRRIAGLYTCGEGAEIVSIWTRLWTITTAPHLFGLAFLGYAGEKPKHSSVLVRLLIFLAVDCTNSPYGVSVFVFGPARRDTHTRSSQLLLTPSFFFVHFFFARTRTSSTCSFSAPFLEPPHPQYSFSF